MKIQEPAPLTDELAGRVYTYTYTTGMSVRLTFGTKDATYEILAGESKGEVATYPYHARHIAKDVYFLQWYESDQRATVAITINDAAKTIYASVALPAPEEPHFWEGIIEKIEK